MAEPKHLKQERFDPGIIPVARAIRQREKQRYLYYIFRHLPDAAPPRWDDVWQIKEAGPTTKIPIGIVAYVSTKGAALEFLANIPPSRKGAYSYGPVLIDDRIRGLFSRGDHLTILEQALK